MRAAAPPVRRILSALERAAQSFLDPASSVREQAVSEVSAGSGFSAPMVERALDWTFSEITGPNMRRLLISELGGEDAADDPALRSPRRTLLVAAGTIFQPAVNGIVYSLLVKSPITVKCSSHERALLPLFVRTLRNADGAVGVAVEVVSGADEGFSNADCVMAYGSDETINSIQSRLAPGTHFIGHGHKVSVAVIGRGALSSESAARQAAKDLAVDVAMYDQSGCLSPHSVYVESGAEISPEAFAGILAKELEHVTTWIPPGRRSAEEDAAVQAFRGEVEFRADRDPRVKYFFGKNLSYTVLSDPDPAFGLSPLGRTLHVKPVRNVSDVLPLLSALAGHVQAVGAAPQEILRPILEPLRHLGASYFPALGRMQRPPLDWQNAGIPCLRGLLNPLPP